MANSSRVSGGTYDVFISFRGIDIRHSFLGHLKKELRQKQIDAYVDDRLERGDDISPALLRAIEESLISLIIFSKDYASSKWCLEELVKIMECMQRNKQIVIPIFYNTDPSDVRHKKGSYADALAEHEKNYKEKVQIWKIVLEKAANLSGFHSSNYGDEVELIEQIAKSLLTRLNKMFQSDTRDIVGIDERIADLESLMCQGSEDVRAIGIWGMGGVGKTTIAKAVFNRFCFEYEGFYFMANVREESEKRGIISLKNELLSKLLEEDDLYIGTPNGISPYVKRRLLRKKVLIVLDDVKDSDQIEHLVGALDYFGSGSRIIITTRDKQVFGQIVDQIYKVKPMSSEDADQLFMVNAFKQTCLDMEWTELSRRVISYAKGIPLAIKVLGSFLYGKTKKEWESQLEKLKKTPYMKIHDVLRLSYDSLDDQEKSIFLYIACFFKGYQLCQIIVLLDACGFSTTIGLKVLRDKALIGWKFEMSFVSMHDLIQEMGREIVRQESMEDLGKRSRLWDPNDIYEVLKNDTGTQAIQSIILDTSKIEEELFLNPHVFARMHKLKFLKFFDESFPRSLDRRGVVHLPQGLGSFPKGLRLLHWDEYPSNSLPSTFAAEKLVELVMPMSNAEKLWDGLQCLVNLKKIDLSSSMYLLELPDFSEANNLEDVDLYGCTNLRLVHPSILSRPKLRSLQLSYCKNITSLRSDIPLKALWYLFLWRCTKLNDFSVTSATMRRLDLSETGVTELPSSIGSLSDLEDLNLKSTAITELPSSIGSLSNLKELNLENCRSLMNLPSQLVDLSSLYDLNIGGCIKLRSLTDLPPSLEEIYAKDCISLETVQFTSMVVDPPNGNMRMLNLSGTAITELPSSIGSLSDLEDLNLKSTAITELPSSIGSLSNLENLNLNSTFITGLPSSIGSLSNLKELNLNNCRSLMNLPSQFVDLRSLRNLRIDGCIQLRSLTDLPPSLEYIYAADCISLETVQFTSINCRSLMHLPSRLVDPRSLCSLIIRGCKQLRSITDLPPSLKEINAEDCISLETIQFTPMAADPHNENMMKIHFKNCVTLDEHLLHVIELQAHLKLKKYAFKHLSPDEIAEDGGPEIYPGSKVPDWFMYRTSQASITIDPYSELQGFIFCVILRPQPLPESYTSFGCYWFLEDNNGRSRRVPPVEYDSFLPWLSIGKLISDHVLLWYDDVDCHYINERIQESRARNQLGTYPKISFEFLAFYDDPAEETMAGMKECGVYPVYASERNKFVEEMKLELGNKTKRRRDIDELEPSEIRVKSSKLR